MNGVAIFQNFGIIKNNAQQTQSLFDNEVCFALPALAELGSQTSKFKNDYHSKFWFFDNGFTDAELFLYKNGSQISTLTNNDYGTFYEYGYGGKTIFDEDRIGYLLDFNKILNEFGEGNYKIKCTATQLIGDPIDYYSFEFSLQTYTPSRAENTTVLEWYKNGNDGDISNVYHKNDYAELNIYNAIRLPNSYFGKPNETKTKEFVKYQNGQEVWTQDKLDFVFTLFVNAVPYYILDFISKDANTNTEMYVTDYNSINPIEFLKVPITSISGSKYNFTDGAKLVSSEFTYKPLYNNFVYKIA